MPTPVWGAVDAAQEALAILEPPLPEGEDPRYVDWHVYVDYDRFGFSAAVGDLDGDGHEDYVVTNEDWNALWWELPEEECCPPSVGAAYIMHGPVCGTIDLDSTAVALEGEGLNALGGGLSPAGDTNGDGLADFVVVGGDEDSAFLVLGPATSGGTIGYLDNVVRITGSSRVPTRRVTGAGDVDGDGIADLATGFYQESSTTYARGIVLLLGTLEGTIDLDEEPLVFREEEEADYAAESIVAGGDMDLDGLGDFVVGAHSASRFEQNCGEAYVLYGADMQAYASSTF